MFSENLLAFFSTNEFGQEAIWSPSNGSGQQTATVIFESPDQDIFGGAGSSTEYAVLYPSNQLVGLANDEVLTINAVNYRVRGEPRRIEDGHLMQAMLTKD